MGATNSKRPPLRQAAAVRLRSVADRLEPLRPPAPPRSPALLIRFGGRWWYRSEITTGEDPDVQLHP